MKGYTFPFALNVVLTKSRELRDIDSFKDSSKQNVPTSPIAPSTAATSRREHAKQQYGNTSAGPESNGAGRRNVGNIRVASSRARSDVIGYVLYHKHSLAPLTPIFYTPFYTAHFYVF